MPVKKREKALKEAPPRYATEIAQLFPAQKEKFYEYASAGVEEYWLVANVHEEKL
jgi:hypothetical protein